MKEESIVAIYCKAMEIHQIKQHQDDFAWEDVSRTANEAIAWVKDIIKEHSND
jgi:hypothetical protein